MRPLRFAGWTKAVKPIRRRSSPLLLSTSVTQRSRGISTTTRTKAREPALPSSQHFLSTNSTFQRYTSSTTKQQSRTMATSTTIKVSTDAPGIYNVGVKPESVERASKLLQENLSKFHIYFNDKGFHSKNSPHYSPRSKTKY